MRPANHTPRQSYAYQLHAPWRIREIGGILACRLKSATLPRAAHGMRETPKGGSKLAQTSKSVDHGAAGRPL